MIEEALLHCPGLGPVRRQQLRDCGLRTWHDITARPNDLPGYLRESLTTVCTAAAEALAEDNIGWFVDTLHPQDRWRILNRWLDRATCFDIETSGLDYDSVVTVIVCRHQGRLLTFIEHDNLDDFLDILEETELLVSFNGSSFDVPRILNAFHIPELPCPHLDLRWTCLHHGLKGSLKSVSQMLGIQRPDDLTDADGSLAVSLWELWRDQTDAAARDQLVRYCASDVVLTYLVADAVAERNKVCAESEWKSLPAAAGDIRLQSRAARQNLTRELFGSAAPAKLRTRRPRRT